MMMSVRVILISIQKISQNKSASCRRFYFGAYSYLIFAGLFTAGAITVAQVANQIVIAQHPLVLTLDQRTDIIIAGGQPPKASYHQIFIYLQALKLAALLAVIFAAAFRLVRSR